ncbi:ATP-binding cassette domain-containing protein [Streptomyces sp. NPDC047928]|uniref:ATP-binding cassette domain-containing protein n=1 Tax=unclassified Streptomyces TaxID=2593676 RepID=UPI003715E816
METPDNQGSPAGTSGADRTAQDTARTSKADLAADRAADDTPGTAPGPTADDAPGPMADAEPSATAEAAPGTTAGAGPGTAAGPGARTTPGREGGAAGRGSGERPRGVRVTADALGLKGPRGWAFRDVTFDAAPGELVAIEGPSGSGRTCLLLALTGRMRPTEGHAEVGGLRLPRKMAAVRRFSALGHVPGVSDLDPAFTVAEHLRERVLLRRRFDGSPLALLRKPSERAADSRTRISAALDAVALDVDALPKGGRTSIRDLERLEALRLSIALALIAEPRLLAVDDTDLKLSDADEAEAWSLLRSIADGGTTVLAVCSEAPDHTTTIRTNEEETADALAETGRA